jgi:MIP family channel proteins
MNATTFQAVLAEFVGTFALVFAGCGACIVSQVYPNSLSVLGIAIVFGAVVGVMIYATGPISGAHFNPAVTLGFLASKRFSPRLVFPYILAQLTAALLASSAHWALFPPGHDFGVTIPNLALAPTVAIEAILTFFLMFVIIAVATDSRAVSGFEGLAIGLTVTLCAAFGGPLTGASMNPARTLGPAVISGNLVGLGAYFVGPILGALFAVGTFELLRAKE